MQKALAQLLQMQKGKNPDADLDSNGTKTPEAVMETDEKDTDKIDESVDVEEIEEVTKKSFKNNAPWDYYSKLLPFLESGSHSRKWALIKPYLFDFCRVKNAETNTLNNSEECS